MSRVINSATKMFLAENVSSIGILGDQLVVETVGGEMHSLAVGYDVACSVKRDLLWWLTLPTPRCHADEEEYRRFDIEESTAEHAHSASKEARAGQDEESAEQELDIIIR